MSFSDLKPTDHPLKEGLGKEVHSGDKKQAQTRLSPELRAAVDEQKKQLELTTDDFNLNLYELNSAFRRAFSMLKIQIFCVMLGIGG